MNLKLLILFLSVTILSGCTAAKATGKTAKFVGKTTWGTAKVTSKVAYNTGKAAYKTGKVAYKAGAATGRATSKAVRTAVYVAKGKQMIPLIKQGNSLYANVKINKKQRAKLLLDTGATALQISRKIARALKIDLSKGDPIMATIANGQTVTGRKVTLKSVELRGVKVRNVDAIVLDYEGEGHSDGLLGMTFLNHFTFQIDADRAELVLEQKAK